MDSSASVTVLDANKQLSWYQTEEKVVISLLPKHLDLLGLEPDATVQLDRNYLVVCHGGVDKYKLELNQLINPEKSSFVSHVEKKKIEITLAKQEAMRWPSLDKAVTALKVAAAQDAATNNNPVLAAMAKSRALEQLVKEVEAEEKDDKDPFKALYDAADDDTKRAMMKSMVESNGRSLNMSWSDVSKKKFDRRDNGKSWEDSDSD